MNNKEKYDPEVEAALAELPEVKLFPQNVPEEVRSLISLAEKWGIRNDLLRWIKLQKATNEELEMLIKELEPYHKLLLDWLGGAEAFKEDFSNEYLCFTHLTLAESDAELILQKRKQV